MFFQQLQASFEGKRKNVKKNPLSFFDAAEEFLETITNVFCNLLACKMLTLIQVISIIYDLLLLFLLLLSYYFFFFCLK